MLSVRNAGYHLLFVICFTMGMLCENETNELGREVWEFYMQMKRHCVFLSY